MSKSIFVLLVFFSSVINAQKREEGFDISFKPTKDAARYYVITEKKDNKWYREAYFIPENTTAMTGWYKDEECKIEDGEFLWYHTNRNLKIKESYSDGKRNGIYISFHENGNMNDSLNYENGYRKGVGLSWYENAYQSDSTNFDGKGNGVQVIWYPDGGSVSSAGRWADDTLKVGVWVYYHENGKIQAKENYINGKVTACSCFTENEIELDSLLCISKEAIFPNETTGWIRFVQKNLNPMVPITKGAPEGIYTVMVQFKVDTEGNLKDVKALTKFGYGMEEEVLRMLSKSPKWIPATNLGKKINAYRKQPVTFQVSSE